MDVFFINKSTCCFFSQLILRHMLHLLPTDKHRGDVREGWLYFIFELMWKSGENSEIEIVSNPVLRMTHHVTSKTWLEIRLAPKNQQFLKTPKAPQQWMCQIVLKSFPFIYTSPISSWSKRKDDIIQVHSSIPHYGSPSCRVRHGEKSAAIPHYHKNQRTPNIPTCPSIPSVQSVRKKDAFKVPMER